MRKDKCKVMYLLRVVVWEVLENGTAASTRTVVATRRSAAADASVKVEKMVKVLVKVKVVMMMVKKMFIKFGFVVVFKGFYC